jgi:hypothetical protein
MHLYGLSLVLSCSNSHKLHTMMMFKMTETRHKCAQVREYIQISNSKSHLYTKNYQHSRKNELKGENSWITKAQDTIKPICNHNQSTGYNQTYLQSIRNKTRGAADINERLGNTKQKSTLIFK